MRLFCSRARAVERCTDNSWCSLCECLPAGYIDQFRSSAFSSQRTGFVMNNTYPVTGGSPQRCDPTGSMPLTCCAVWALEKQWKKKCVRQGFFGDWRTIISSLGLHLNNFFTSIKSLDDAHHRLVPVSRRLENVETQGSWRCNFIAPLLRGTWNIQRLYSKQGKPCYSWGVSGRGFSTERMNTSVMYVIPFSIRNISLN